MVTRPVLTSCLSLVPLECGNFRRSASARFCMVGMSPIIALDVQLHAEHSGLDKRAIETSRNRGAVGGAHRVSSAQAEAGGGASVGGCNSGCEDANCIRQLKRLLRLQLA